MRTPELNLDQPKIAWAVLLAVATMSAGCPPAQVRAELPVQVAVQQWRSVQTQYPYVAAAYLESLLALAGESPDGRDRGRDMAFTLARQSGLVKGQRPACAPCEAARSEDEVQRYVSCLVARLNCLQPR